MDIIVHLLFTKIIDNRISVVKWLDRRSRVPEVTGSNPVRDVYFTSTFHGGPWRSALELSA
jgi:hypothetical protein